MEKIYDKRDRVAGYTNGNDVYDKGKNLIGYVQGNVVYNTNYQPVYFLYNDVFYWMNNRPWAYIDGRAVRDLNGRRIGRVGNIQSAMVSSGLLLSGNLTQNQNQYEQPASIADNSGRYSPYNNVLTANGSGGFGLGGIMQNIRGIGRSIFGGGNNMPTYNPSYNQNYNQGYNQNYNQGYNQNYNQSYNPNNYQGANESVPTNNNIPINNGSANMAPENSLNNLLNLGKVLFTGQQGQPAAGGFGPLGATVGKFLLKNPKLIMSVMSKFIP